MIANNIRGNMNMCVFCMIANGELPASIVYEDERVIAFLDLQPFTMGHVLVVPKEHVVSITDLSNEDAGHLMQVGQLIDRALQNSEIPCEGVNIILADGKSAGQDVDHVHMHVFPRFTGDHFMTCIDANIRLRANRDQLEGAAAKIRTAIENLN